MTMDGYEVTTRFPRIVFGNEITIACTSYADKIRRVREGIK